MAAFTSFYQHHLDSSIFHLPNTINDITNNANSNSISSLFTQPDHETQLVHDHHNLELINNYEGSVNKNSMDCSSIVTDYKYFDTSGKLVVPIDKKRKSKEGSSANCAQSKDKREVKGKKQKKMKDEKKATEEGYIHVRARRGQATDSHSLAERVRRERISERMKQLQALVPGCEKVTGKALMLDEIINYVQSLQNQVEFLSMKLASVNPMFYDFGMDLESLMVRPDQQCSPTTANNYALLDNAPNSLTFQQAQIPNTLPQGHIEVVWEVDEQRQKIISQSEMSNSLFSLH